MESLAESAGYIVVNSIEQVRSEDPHSQIGKGKVDELSELVKNFKAEKVIFYNNLKPIQSYNIAKSTGVEAIDRFQIILEIFAKRASTKEAKFQIQLANLRYQLPRARESVRLARQGEQPGFMGIGRYEVDVYYESIKRQIAHIRNELKKIRGKRGIHRIHRKELGFSLVSLAGYTNAGKTTLFNIMTRESLPVNKGLFTTLSTTTRAIQIENKKALLTDTVGFIDHLPLVLVEAFNSTLEETILSDAIILVVDMHESLEEVQRKLDCCINTIQEIGAGGIPIVTAFNKIDLLSKDEFEERYSIMSKIAPNPVAISSLKEIKLTELKKKVLENLEKDLIASFILPSKVESFSFLSELHDQANSMSTYYNKDDVILELNAPSEVISKAEAKIRKLGGRMVENIIQKLN